MVNVNGCTANVLRLHCRIDVLAKLPRIFSFAVYGVKYNCQWFLFSDFHPFRCQFLRFVSALLLRLPFAGECKTEKEMNEFGREFCHCFRFYLVVLSLVSYFKVIVFLYVLYFLAVYKPVNKVGLLISCNEREIVIYKHCHRVS